MELLFMLSVPGFNTCALVLDKIWVTYNSKDFVGLKNVNTICAYDQKTTFLTIRINQTCYGSFYQER